jgi:cation transport ATPase
VDQLSGSDRELDWAEDDEPAFVVGDDLLMLGDLDPEETEYKRGLQKEQQREEQKQRREQERQRRKDKEAQRLKAQPQPQQQQQPIAVPSVGQIPVLPQTLSASNVETVPAFFTARVLQTLCFIVSCAQDASGVGMPVWEGALGRPDGGEFFVSCTQHGGPRAFTLDLPAVLHTAGRLKYSAVSDFLPQVQLAYFCYILLFCDF